MNLANKLTLFRIILVPLFAAAILTDSNFGYTWALIIFAAASLTDFLDGHIARKYNMITPFGKFLDPIADKILVATALICFAGLGWTSAWVVALIIAREFIVSGIRLAAVESADKTVIAARFSGKLKTAFTMISICAVLLMNIFQIGSQFYTDILMYICAALTVISGAQYVWDYRGVFK